MTLIDEPAVTSYHSLSPPRQVVWACRILASEGFSDQTLARVWRSMNQRAR